MKDYLEKRREELSKREEGFTLMEMLIVVAIIAVLIAIAIPIFTSQLEKAREATDLANVRSAYAEVAASYLTDNEAKTIDVAVTQTQDNWQTDGDNPTTKVGSNLDGNGDIDVPAKTSGNYTVSISSSGEFSCS